MKSKFADTVLAVALSLAAGASSAGYLTPIFGEDGHTSELTPLASTPTASAREATFLSLLQGVSTETFELKATDTPAPLTLNFLGSSAQLTATLSGSGRVGTAESGKTDGFGRYSIPSATSTQFWEADADAGDFHVQFGQAIAAFGFYGIDIGDYGGQLLIDLLAEDQNSILATFKPAHSQGTDGSTAGSVVYFGVVSDSATSDFYGIRFRLEAPNPLPDDFPGDVFAFDNFTIAERSQIRPPTNGTPEPGTLALLGLALAGAATARRSKK